jgi:NAD(P)-dependent dehydrogenase (short-subunit alcohol dehydrogenase family)
VVNFKRASVLTFVLLQGVLTSSARAEKTQALPEDCFSNLSAADLDAIASTIPLRRLGTPDDIGAAVLYLASPASSWVTGQNILVAGGRTERSYQYGGREKKK